MPVKLLTSGGGGVTLTPSSSIASDQTVYVPVSGTSGGTLVCSDSSGNVGIGVTPSAWQSTWRANQILNASFVASTSQAYMNYNAYYNSGWKYIANGVATSYLQDNDGAHIWYKAASGTAGNAITWNQAMTLDSSGNLLLGTTSTSPTSGLVGIVGLQAYHIVAHGSGSSSGAGYLRFDYNGSAIGSITQSGTTNIAVNGTSDYRLKTNVRDADAKSFHKVQFRDFEWIDGRHDCGVIAHELQEVYPDLVLGEKDATETRDIEVSPEVKDDEGNVVTEAVVEKQEFPVYQQVNYIGLICRMGTVLQQQQSIIESLTERIAALEGGK